MRVNHRWNDDERDIIRRDYRHTRTSRCDLAAKLGVTEYGIAGQISRMGIGKSDDRHPWSPEEDEELRKLIPKYCVRRIARMMHRSINSVTVRAKRLNASRRVRDGWYTKREACEILGHDHKWLQKRIDCGVLKASYHHEHRPQRDGAGSWHIAQEDLVHFIRRYPQELVGCNLDIIMIVELLAGIENNG